MHGLMAASDVNNTEPGVSQSHGACHVKTGSIRPSVVHHTDHSLEERLVNASATAFYNSCNATHNISYQSQILVTRLTPFALDEVPASRTLFLRMRTSERD
jgi:hypothetical protein